MLELIYVQGNMFIISFIMGCIMGFSYDVFRGVRKVFPHIDLVVDVEDIIYWFTWTLVFIDNIFNYNDGEFRIYIFVIAIVGLLIYKYTIGGVLLKVLIYILCFAKKCADVPKKMLKNGIKWGKIKLSTLKNKKRKKQSKSNG